MFVKRQITYNDCMEEKIYFREKYLKKIRPFYHDNLVKVITGIRRCGKSFILKMIMKELLEAGVSEERIIYLPLDKRGFKNIKDPNALEKAIEERLKKDDVHYIFIDEVQNVPGFEEIVLAYEEEGHSVFLTGSNSYLLSDEISTKLTGRYVTFDVFTLDFEEYLAMKRFLGKETKDENVEFEEYLRYGGFPKSLSYDGKDAKIAYIHSIIEEIFLKDIKRRKKITHVSVFNRVKTFLIANYGQAFSMRNLVNFFRNEEKVPVTERTLNAYIDCLKKAKIIYECDRFDTHTKLSLRGEQKYYLADPAIFFAETQEAKINYGPALENVVFLHLLSQGYSVSIGLIGKWECDFVARDDNRNISYFQVTYSIGGDEETKEREYRPFRSIRDSFPRYVLSLDTFLNQQEGVKHENVIKFLLDNRQLTN